MEIKASVDMNQLKIIEKELKRFLMSYKFGLEEVKTKINILNEEFQYIHDYNPIEHVKSRVKSPESIIRKVKNKGIEHSLPAIQENIHDIAGIRITCSFISDIYTISEMLQQQKDITVVECKDFIKNPKPNGYKSLHLILQIPVFMSDGEHQVYVELQIRTIAMDFWASLEHKIYYKYDREVPNELLDELKNAAMTVSQLDEKMEKLHLKINQVKEEHVEEEEHPLLTDAIISNFLSHAKINEN